MIKKTKYKFKSYAHFDKKTSPTAVRHLVEDPEWVAKHGFYPFISYVIKSIKYDSQNKKKKEKKRRIFYSAHIDRYIYQYYSSKLNELYNKYVAMIGTNRCAIAYRDCLKKSNIEFAKEVFDYIRSVQEAWIIVGDFTDFFDNLDHSYLKKQITCILGESTLPKDLYSVFKSITKYSYVEFQDLLELLDIDIKNLRKLPQIMDIKDFREHKKELMKCNENDFGIPQGSAISSTLANVYMLEFDKVMNNQISDLGGLYRRYSDDFIIIAPANKVEDIKSLWEKIKIIIDSVPRLILQNSKVSILKYHETTITNITDEIITDQTRGKDRLDYLGFTFDGEHVHIRDKSIHKFYSKMYQKIDTSNKYTHKYKRNVFRQELYKRYSHLGKKKTKKNMGNFLTYIDRAQRVFGDKEPIKSKTKKHWSKIHKRLEKIK